MTIKKIILVRLFIAVLFFMLYLFIPDSAKSQENGACYDFNSCAPQEVVLSCFESSANGCIDWDHRIIYAIGIGVPNPNLETASQKNFSAVRAATVVAQRNMLEMIQGVQITSSTTVEMGMAQNDTINSQIQGTVKRVQPIGNPAFLNDGSVAVTVRYFMDDLSTLLLTRSPYTSGNAGSQSGSNSPYAKKQDVYAANSNAGSAGSNPSVTPSSAAGGAYTGLILNAQGLSLKPALSPKVIDENGNEVYGVEKTGREFNIEQGIMGYAKSVDAAKDNTRVKGNVLEITVKKTSGNSGSDMVISNDDAKKLAELYETQSFLREGRAIAVID